MSGEASTHVVIASTANKLGDFALAADHYATALSGYEQIGDESGQAHTLDLLGVVNELRGDLPAAENYHLTAIELLRRLDHRQGLAHSLDNLGSVRQQLGRLDEAFANHTEARELAVELGDRACEAYALNNLGNTHRLARRLDEAVACQQEARRVADLVVDPNLRTQLYLDRGETALAIGDTKAALHAYRAALDLFTGMGERAQRAKANHRIAVVLHDTGRHQPGHWRDALTEYTELGLPEADQVRAELANLTCACTEASIGVSQSLPAIHRAELLPFQEPLRTTGPLSASAVQVGAIRGEIKSGGRGWNN